MPLPVRDDREAVGGLYAVRQRPLPRISVGLAIAAVGLAAAPIKKEIPYSDARAIVEAHQADLPQPLKSIAPDAIEAAWPGWVSRHNAEIRARLAQGDEDSLVNLWLYGTAFTRLPRVTDRQAARLAQPDAVQDLLLGRLDDFVAAIGSPSANDRLRFARALLTARGINPTTAAGREQARIYLVGLRERVIAENQRYRIGAESPSAYSTLFHERGLSTDTRLTASFAIDRALDALAASGRVAPSSVMRIAIVGPGLDFTDKAEGYDFYPLQTIQPFALIDSLLRLKLGAAGMHVLTLDLSPRVNRHLDDARRRAAGGAPYTVQLPLARDDDKHQWHPDLVAYWLRFGREIGGPATASPAPAIAGDVQVRAVAIRPAVVTSITAHDVNIIVERLDPLADDERFDLVVATNILVYYDVFDQSLALANISKMLKPGGFFLTNYAVSPMAPMETSASLVTPVLFDRQQNGDTIYAYQKK